MCHTPLALPGGRARQPSLLGAAAGRVDGVTMSIHKLTAGSGYDYLTRQVAAQDATAKGHTGLASYYTVKGENPGQWVGSGVAELGGLAVGDTVTAEQMQALFGAGMHPLAQQRMATLHGPDLGAQDYQGVTRLGAPYKVWTPDVSAFRLEVATRIGQVNARDGLPSDWPVPAVQRARIRTQVAVEFFRAEHGRDPADAREIAATIAKHSRPKTTAVAGFDLTFSPVKSVSTLWAVADPATAAAIERAHHAAVADALTFIETHALFTREGANGVRQVDVAGLVATSFTHRDSRAGDPDLHTHVAVANKVRTGDGKWLAIDGRVLFKATVTASETYNTALEGHLHDALGLRFAARQDTNSPADSPADLPAPTNRAKGIRAGTTGRAGGTPGTGKRPIREVIGVDPALNLKWSARRAAIEVHRSQLAADFQATHGRPPTPIESIQLAQQATLATRQAKHEPRSLADQRATWAAQARDVLGGDGALRTMLHTVFSAAAAGARTDAAGAGTVSPTAAGDRVDAAWMDRTARAVLDAMQTRRSTWQIWHVRAEALRQVRGADLSTADVNRVVDLLVDEVLGARSVSLASDTDTLRTRRSPVGGPVVREPAALRRKDGSSVYQVAGSTLFTSARVLAAEQRILARAGQGGGLAVGPRAVEMALAQSAADGLTLNAGQATLARQMATSGVRVQLAIAPAGAGKTTAMRALATAWINGGGTVVGLAPSAAAAAALGEQMGATTDTLAKLTWALRSNSTGQVDLPEWAAAIDDRTLVVIDEAGMADTLSLDATIEFALAQGASVRLVGDDQQLAAVGAGGVLRDIWATHGGLHLTELMRFTDPAEGAASLALREGRPEALGFYLDAGRVHVGDLATMTQDVFDAWAADRDAGKDSVMLAPSRDLVATLNHRARAHRLHHDTNPDTPGPGAIEGTEPAGRAAPVAAPVAGSVVELADGNHASAGDLVITRANDRRLRTSASDWVKNGDRWTILHVEPDGSLQVAHTHTHRQITLPRAHVATYVELGYAATIHTAQGLTADTGHTLLTGTETRQLTYTAATRGRTANHLYLQVVGDGDPHTVITPDTIHPRTATDLLEAVLARDDAPRSATTTARDLTEPGTLLGAATARYLDALHVAAADVLGTAAVAKLDATADQVVPNLTGQPAWPTLRAHLLLLAAADLHPATDGPITAAPTGPGADHADASAGVQPNADPPAEAAERAVSRHLAAAVNGRELDTAGDPAAVLDWRLDDTGLRSAGPGPLPWVPAVPTALLDHPQWGDYLRARADLVTDLAERVRHAAKTEVTPRWASHGGARPNEHILGDVQVWRAANTVPDSDQRPTGPRQLGKAAATWQATLHQQVAGRRGPAVAEWSHLIGDVAPSTRTDDYTPLLAKRLAAINRAGLDARHLLHAAAAQGPLPDDHASAALWWRLARHLSPAVANACGEHLTVTAWTPQLPALLGPRAAEELQRSAWWPALVTAVDHALARGSRLEDLLTAPGTGDRPDPYDQNQGRTNPNTDFARLNQVTSVASSNPDVDPYQALVWRISVLADLPPDPDSVPDRNDPTDNRDDVTADGDSARDPTNRYSADDDLSQHLFAIPDQDWSPIAPPATGDPDPDEEVRSLTDDEWANEPSPHAALAFAALGRDVDRQRRQPLPLTDEQQHRDEQRAWQQETANVPLERMAEVNELAAAYYQDRLNTRWAGAYLTQRFGHDLTDHPHIRPGYAPPGWTNLITHLRGHGVTDLELTETGLASLARTGRLIDRFRDRVMFPITHHQQVLGFVGRRHPDRDPYGPGVAGPKYLNTPTTPLFHKGTQLYGAHPHHLANGAIPAFVEGPMDAIAVTLATNGRYLGVAPLGTALTEQQAAQLAAFGRDPVVATDADPAGQAAATRAFWLLTARGLDPTTAVFNPGDDPAGVLTEYGPAALSEALDDARPLSHILLTRLHRNLAAPAGARLAASAAVLAAASPTRWAADSTHVADRLQLPPHAAIAALADAVRIWDADSARQAADQTARLATTTNHRPDPQLRARMPEQRWAALAGQLDPRLPLQGDWAALAGMLDTAHQAGFDVEAVTRTLVGARPLNDQPAQDLRYRLVTLLPANEPPPQLTCADAHGAAAIATTKKESPSPANQGRRGPQR